MTVSKTTAIRKYQNDDIFIDRKRSGQPKVFNSREDRLLRNVVTCSLMSSSKKIQIKLMETGTVANIKAIRCRLSLDFDLESRKPAKNLACDE